MSLYLPPAEIERKILANVRMYEEDPRGLAINETLANHWRDCLHKLHEYQEGRIALAELPLDVREMGWTMPTWGYARD